MPRPEGERARRLAAEIRIEIGWIDRTVESGGRVLERFDAADEILLRAAGDVLHDFYTGIEKALLRIAPEVNGGVPEGPAWHRRLLESMTAPIPDLRPAVLRTATAETLDEYLRFRHRFRAAYGVSLRPEPLRDLLARLPDAWRSSRADLEAFAAFLDEIGRAVG